MLHLYRKEGEFFFMFVRGVKIGVSILASADEDGETVIGIKAPKEVKIFREEILKGNKNYVTKLLLQTTKNEAE